MNFNVPFFNPPYFYNRPYRYLSNISKNQNHTIDETPPLSEKIEEKKYSDKNNIDSSSEYFFELFGIHLYLDDVLLICLLFFFIQRKCNR